MNKKPKTKDLTLAIFCVASYAALVFFLAPISFLQIQLRVANALIGLVPIMGMPAVYGLTIGIFIGNIFSPLGPIDLLSPFPSFIGLLILHRLRKRGVLLGLVLYSLIVSAWVAFMLATVFGLPYVITFVYVFVGVATATAGLGFLLYKAVSSTGFRKLLEGER